MVDPGESGEMILKKGPNVGQQEWPNDYLKISCLDRTWSTTLNSEEVTLID